MHHQKSSTANSQPGIFDTASHPIPLEKIDDTDPPPEIDDEIDLENLFYPPPTHTTPQLAQPEKPPDPNLDFTDEFHSNSSTIPSQNFNSLHVHLDASKQYTSILSKKSKKLVSFYLTKHDQLIRTPNLSNNDKDND
jgi:hypothetical protein